ncbi:MAG: GAF domain-containing protein, partial [Desulfobulbia bacterium]
MDSIDVLGNRPDRHEAFSEGLLAEAGDSDLQQIVEKAADELDAPVALVSLVLDHIQFFKAQYGLPAELAAAKSTRRDVSFCQFVVRDGKPFEVNNAPNDSRIPQHLVNEYN